MYTRDKAEQITLAHVRQAMRVGHIPLPIETNIGMRLLPRHAWVSMIIRKDSIKVFDTDSLKTIQIDLLRDLFRRYGVVYSDSEGEGMLDMFFGGTIARYAKSFVRSLPVVGKLLWDESLSVMAGASTYALAQVAVVRLECEQKFFDLNLRAIKTVYTQEFAKGKELVAKLEQDTAVGRFLAIDFEAAQQAYAKACRPNQPVTQEDDPFAIEIDDAPAQKTEPTSPTQSTSTSAAAGNLTAQFEQLVEKKTRGMITEEEFQRQRQKLLAQL